MTINPLFAVPLPTCDRLPTITHRSTFCPPFRPELLFLRCMELFALLLSHFPQPGLLTTFSLHPPPPLLSAFLSPFPAGDSSFFFFSHRVSGLLKGHAFGGAEDLSILFILIVRRPLDSTCTHSITFFGRVNSSSSALSYSEGFKDFLAWRNFFSR